VIYNEDADSSAYEAIKHRPRPGHGDYTWTARYGVYDYRGGGRGSGRATVGHVIGGAVAKKLLKLLDIKVISHVTQIGDIKASPVSHSQIEEYSTKNPVRCADPQAAPKMDEAIFQTMKADILLVIGTSLEVYPAAGLIDYTSQTCEKYIIDPKARELNHIHNLTVIQNTAGEGVPALVNKLIKNV